MSDAVRLMSLALNLSVASLTFVSCFVCWSVIVCLLCRNGKKIEGSGGER